MANGGAVNGHAPLRWSGSISKPSGPGPGEGTRGQITTMVLGRRPRLPGSRALLGGLLVAAALVGLFALVSQVAGDERSYVVSRRSVSAGAVLQPGDLALERLRLAPAVRRHSFDATAGLVGARLLAPLAPGVLVQSTMVARGDPPRPRRELSFSVERGRLGAGLDAGQTVDVVATYGSGAEAFTAVVVRSAGVVSVDRGRSGLSDAASTVTVAVDDEAGALALAHASALGKLTLVSATGTAPPLPPPVPQGVYRPAGPAGASR